MRRILESKRGIAVIMAMWLLAVLAVIGTTFAYMMRLEPIIARHHRDEVKAMYVAMAGVDKAYALLGTDSSQREIPEPPKTEETLTDDTETPVGTYKVKMYPLYVFAFQGGTKQFFRYNTHKNEWAEKKMKDARKEIGPGGALAGDGTNFLYALRGGGEKDFYRYEISRNKWEKKKGKVASTPEAIGWGGALAHWYEVNYYECPECGSPPEYDEPGNCPEPDCGEELEPNTSHYFYATRGASTKNFYRYSVDDNDWENCPEAPYSVSYGGALAYAGEDYIYTLQGGNTKGFSRYSISYSAWENCPEAPYSVSYGGALAYYSNYIYATRGGSSTDFWRYEISTNTWNPDPGESPAITGGTPAIAPGTIGAGGALAWDGVKYIYALKGGTNTGQFYRYEISENEWTTMPRVSYKDKQGIHYVTIAGGGSLAVGDLYRIVSTGYIPDKTNPRAKKKIEVIIDIRPKSKHKRRILYWKEIPED